MDTLSVALTAVGATVASCWGILVANRASELKSIPVRQNLPASKQADPSLTVVLPCCGDYEFPAIAERWNSQLNSAYSGPISFVYVVDSVEDPAFLTICRYLTQVHGLEEAGQAGLTRDATCLADEVVLETTPLRAVRLVVAGRATETSQKIHNILRALRSCKTEFVAFVDDDIRMHCGTYSSLVTSLLVDSRAMVATGYSVEVPICKAGKGRKHAAPFANHLVMVYRMLNLISFAFVHVPLCWGGCFCIRRQDIYKGTMPPYTAWADGGYSEDTLVSHIAHRQGRSIVCPKDCIFINELSPSNTFARSYIHYLSRQIFVLKTHHSTYDRVANTTLAVLCFSIFLCLDGIILLTIMRAAGCLVKLGLLGIMRTLAPLRSTGPLDAVYSILAALSDRWDLSSAAGMAQLNDGVFQMNVSLIVLTLLAAVHNGCFMFLVTLCNRLSPEKLRPRTRIRLGTTVAALIVHCLTMPFIMLRTLSSPTITWGSNTYVCRAGKVREIRRVEADVQAPAKPSKKRHLEHAIEPSTPVVKERVPAE